MSFMVATSIQTPSVGTTEANDVFYDQLVQHRDAERFARTRIVVMSEGHDPADNLVTDVNMDWVNNQQRIVTTAMTFQSTDDGAKTLFSRLNDHLDEALKPLTEVNDAAAAFAASGKLVTVE